MYQKSAAQREFQPFIAAANGGTIDWETAIGAYDEHRAIRDIMCHGYVGTDAQIGFYDRVRALGGTVMPLGEGTLTAACGTLLEKSRFASLGLPVITAQDALRTSGSLTGQISYELLDGMPVWSHGYYDLATTGNYGFPRPALQLVEYEQ